MAKDTKIVSLFDRNRVNYAKLLVDFVKPIEGEYGDVETLEIGLSAWNTSNMLAEMPENFIDPQFAAAKAGTPDDVIEVLEFLIKRKKKYFAEYDLFIFDFEILDKTEEISVQTMPIEEYMVAIQGIMNNPMPDDDIFDGLFDDIYDDDDDEMYEDDAIYDKEGGINREAIFLQLKSPVLKYIKKHLEHYESDREILPSKILLFFNRFIDFDAWLDDSYKEVMEKVLLDYIDEDLLPKRFSFKKFKSWFDYQYIENVDDFEIYF